MATSGSTNIAVTAYDTLQYNWWKIGNSIANNYTDIGWNLNLIATNYGRISSSVAKTWAVNIDGTYYSGTTSIAISNNTTKTLASGTTRIYHNANGTKTFSYSFSQEFNIVFSGSNIGSIYGEGTGILDSIPRQADFTEHYIYNTGLDYIIVHWNANTVCDAVQYSINNGAWVNTSGLDYRINNLYPNTTYNIRTRIRRADSQLWTETSNIPATTKDISRVISASDINFGDVIRITSSNPSGMAKNLRIETLNPTETVATRENISNDVTIVLSDSEWDLLYKKLGDNNSMQIRYVIDTVGNTTYSQWIDKILTLQGNQKTIKKNSEGIWKRGKTWKNINGVNRRAVIWKKINGTWRRSI